MSADHQSPNVTSPANKPVRTFDELGKHCSNSNGVSSTQGRDFLAPALEILPLLEALSELHPVAKAVVGCFKVVVTFEKERRENDSRVTVVFLAQADMMRALLELKHLDNGSIEPRTATSDRLTTLLARIRDDILACANAIDTYYKERRIVKYFKAHSWKEQLLDFVQKFNTHRKDIQFALSIRVAVDVDGLVSKVDVVMTSLFQHRSAWEKRLASKISEYGNLVECIGDDGKLRTLVTISEEASLGTFTSRSNTISEKDIGANDSMELLRREIYSSLDTLFQKNVDIFQRKLGLQTAQIEETVIESAEHVIRQLSGPHERLQDENLRDIWKNMNWGFCIDNGQFVTALREYYLDRFSEHQAVINTPRSFRGNGADGLNQNRSYGGSMSTSKTDDGWPFESSDLHDDDVWTLEYMSARYTPQISEAVDSDMSGLVTIQEANYFTAKKPRDWNLPQWCAYWAAGWAYELFSYQNRLETLLEHLVQEQAQVLPNNRPYIARFLNSTAMGSISALARGPHGQRIRSTALQTLVEEKIERQDHILRERLRALKYDIDAPDTIRLLCGKEPIENYALQLFTLLLEHYFKVMQLCATEILDAMEFSRMWENLGRILSEVRFRLERLGELSAASCLNVEAKLDAFSGGIFRIYHRDLQCGDEKYLEYQRSEVVRRLSAASVVNTRRNEVKIGSTHETREMLIYSTWDAHRSCSERLSAAKEVPPSWNEGGDIITHFGWTTKRDQSFPFHEDSWCDGCQTMPIVGQARFKCLDCSDIDLCAECQILPHKQAHIDGHTSNHSLIKIGLPLPVFWCSWAAALGLYQLERLPSRVTLPRDDSDSDKGINVRQGGIVCSGFCGRINPPGQVFKCLELACQDFYLCTDCESIISGNPLHPPEPDKHFRHPEMSHRSWHTLLVIQEPSIRWINPLHLSEPHLYDVEIDQPPQPTAIENRMRALEDRLETVNDKLDRMESSMSEMKELLVHLITSKV